MSRKSRTTDCGEDNINKSKFAITNCIFILSFLQNPYSFLSLIKNKL